MARIKNTAEARLYDAENAVVGTIKFESYRSSREKVSIEIDGRTYVVYGDDFKLAIDNCMNVGQ